MSSPIRYEFPLAIPWKEGEAHPALRCMRYGLGWMIKAEGIGKHCGAFPDIWNDFIMPNWRSQKNYPTDEKLSEKGLIIPSIRKYGVDHVFFQVASNYYGALGSLLKKQFLEDNVWNGALDTFNWTRNSFKDLDGGLYHNLVWLRWPKRGVPRGVDSLCIGRHDLPDNFKQDHQQLGPTVDSTSGDGLRQVPPEMQYILEYKYWKAGASRGT